MAAKWKEPPRDALDKLILSSADLDLVNVSVEQVYYCNYCYWLLIFAA